MAGKLTLANAATTARPKIFLLKFIFFSKSLARPYFND